MVDGAPGDEAILVRSLNNGYVESDRMLTNRMLTRIKKNVSVLKDTLIRMRNLMLFAYLKRSR